MGDRCDGDAQHPRSLDELTFVQHEAGLEGRRAAHDRRTRPVAFSGSKSFGPRNFMVVGCCSPAPEGTTVVTVRLGSVVSARTPARPGR
jgi:hypothetical protein